MVDEWAYHEPMVGKEFQATVPRLLKQCRVNVAGERRQVFLDVNNTETEEGRMVWDGHQHGESVIEEWLKFVAEYVTNSMTAAHKADYDYVYENALELLHGNGGDPERAIESLQLGPTKICRPKVKWSPQEVEIFMSSYNSYGKDFHAITAMLPAKTSKQVAQFYFDHKTDEEFFDPPSGETKGAIAGVQELSTEEQQLSIDAHVPAVKLLAAKRKLVAESARMGKISRKQAAEVSSLDSETTDKVFDLLVARKLIKPAEE